MGSMLTLPCVPPPELEADQSIRCSAGGKWDACGSGDAHYPQAFQHSACWQSHLRTRCTFTVVLERRALHARFMSALVIGLVTSLNGVTVVSAQTYPQRAVKFILPFVPAAGVDITARLLGEKLAA